MSLFQNLGRKVASFCNVRLVTGDTEHCFCPSHQRVKEGLAMHAPIESFKSNAIIDAPTPPFVILERKTQVGKEKIVVIAQWHPLLTCRRL